MHYMLLVVKKGKGLCPVKVFTRHSRIWICVQEWTHVLHWTQAAPVNNVVSLNLLLSYDNMFFLIFYNFQEIMN